MAKQSGIHQLRGKVGEHSYYRQTGVESGLVRGINPAMSERVKTSPEYANVRLNNAEFGQAGRIAKVLGLFITPKYRPMILPFSQSKMAKVVLEAIKQSDADWGKRNLAGNDQSVCIDALNFVRKNMPDDYGVELTRTGDELGLSVDDVMFPAKLLAIGADGYKVRLVCARPWIGTYVDSAEKFAESYARGTRYDDDLNPQSTQTSFDYQFPAAPPSGWPATSVDFIVVIIMPYRNVNNKEYILQEHCTYYATELPEGD